MRYFIFKFLMYITLIVINLELSFSIVYSIKKQGEYPSFSLYFWILIIYLIFYFFHQLMTRRMVTTNESYLIIKANILAILAVFAIMVITKSNIQYSRMIIITFFSLNLLLPIWVFIIKHQFLKLSFLRKDVFVICDEPGYTNIKKWFSSNNAFGFNVTKTINISSLPYKDVLREIDQALESKKYFAAVISINRYSSSKIFYFIDHIQKDISRVIVLPKINTIPLFNAEVINSINHKGLAFFIKNNLLNDVDKALKNIFEKVISIFMFLISLPLIIVLYFTILLTTRNNPIFKQKRVGQNGRLFSIYKFRTMVNNADEVLEKVLEHDTKARKEYEKYCKLKKDPRITPIGKFLRKTSLDELPQLFNIIRGDMALVGPRPILENEIETYGEFFTYYKVVKPGITGLWQVSGRNELDFKERTNLDVWYVRNWSFQIDFIILLKTVVIVLSRKGSY